MKENTRIYTLALVALLTLSAYLLADTDGDELKDKYEVHLFKLSQQLFLDLLPLERHDESIPVHQLMKVIRIEPQLVLAGLKYDWLKQWLTDHPQAPRHEYIPEPPKAGERKQQLVLTASTAGLQSFLLAHVNDTNAWADPTELRRK